MIIILLISMGITIAITLTIMIKGFIDINTNENKRNEEMKKKKDYEYLIKRITLYLEWSGYSISEMPDIMKEAFSVNAFGTNDTQKLIEKINELIKNGIEIDELIENTIKKSFENFCNKLEEK